MLRLHFVNKIIVAMVLLSFPLFGQDFNDALRLSEPGLSSDARALGMGNSNVSISDNYSGTFFNPAGLGLVKKSQISFGLNNSNYENNSTLFGKTTGHNNSTTDFSQIGFVLPFPTYRGSFVIGFGYNQRKDFNNVIKFDGFNSGNNSLIQDLTSIDDDIPYLLGLSYPIFNDITDEHIQDVTEINGRLNQSGDIKNEGSINSWSFSGSVEIAKNTFLGGTFNIISGEYKRFKNYYEDDTKDIYSSNLLLDPDDEVTRDFQSFLLKDIIEWDISGWDFKAGLLYKLNKHVNFGTTIKFPTFYQIEEKYFVNGSSIFADGDGYDLEPDESNSKYDIDTPFEFAGGVSFNLNGLTVSIDATLIDYSTMEFTSGLDSETRYNNNLDIKEIFDNVVNYNFGMEYQIPKTNLSLRGGFIFNPSPFKNDPSDYDKKYLTAGIGYLSNNQIALDIGYAHGYWKNFIDNYGSGESRILQYITSDKLVINLTYLF